MDRRTLLKGLLGATAAAVAAEFGAPEYMGEEIREELIKDLSKDRIQVQVPKKVFDNRPVWTSVKGVQDVWVDHIHKEYAKAAGDAFAEQIDDEIMRTARMMVRAIDKDLEEAKVDTDKKIIIQPPRFRLTGKNDFLGRPAFELKAGVEKKKGLLGSEEYRVGYLSEGLVDRFGKRLSA